MTSKTNPPVPGEKRKGRRGLPREEKAKTKNPCKKVLKKENAQPTASMLDGLM